LNEVYFQKRRGIYLWCLYKSVIYNKNFTQLKSSSQKVGRLPTMVYLAINPNSKEDEFIGNDKRG